MNAQRRHHRPALSRLVPIALAHTLYDASSSFLTPPSSLSHTNRERERDTRTHARRVGNKRLARLLSRPRSSGVNQKWPPVCSCVAALYTRAVKGIDRKASGTRKNPPTPPRHSERRPPPPPPFRLCCAVHSQHFPPNHLHTEYERDIWQPSPMRAHPDAGYGMARRRRRNRVRGKDSTVFSRRRRRLQ
jgi:hypothetical protein